MSDSITERIKKLLRLSKSSNRHEAELAMQRAFELAEKHRIDVESLDLDEDSRGLVHAYYDSGSRLSFLRKKALQIVNTFFHVTVVILNCRILFVGRSSDIVIAEYAYEFLVKAGSRCLKQFETEERGARRKVNQAKRRNYLEGFFYGIARTLSGLRTQQTLTDAQLALVIHEKASRDQVIKEVCGKTKDVPLALGRKVRSALDAGFEQGRDTRINQPLGTSPGSPLQLQ